MLDALQEEGIIKIRKDKVGDIISVSETWSWKCDLVKIKRHLNVTDF